MPSRDKEIETLTKAIGAGLESGIEALNAMLPSEVRPYIPTLHIVDTKKADKDSLFESADLFSIVEMAFNGSLKGNSALVFSHDNAWKFMEKLAGDDSETGELDFVSRGVLTEIGNIVLNRVLGAVSNELALNLDYVVPNFFKGNPRRLWIADEDRSGLVAKTNFAMDDLDAKGSIVVFFEQSSFDTLTSIITTPGKLPEKKPNQPQTPGGQARHNTL